MFSKFTRFLSISSLLATSALSSFAEQPLIKRSFDRTFFFGDSLTDGSKLSESTPPLPQPIFSFNSIYLNGDTWAKFFTNINNFTYGVDSGDRIDDSFNYTPSPTLPTTTNFARAGAASRTGENKYGYRIDGLVTDASHGFTTSQIDNFFAYHTPNKRDLINIWIGHNNLTREITSSSTSADLALIAKNASHDIITGMERLHTAGARNFLLLNLASFADTPYFIDNQTAAQRAGATLYTQEFTKEFTAQTNNLPKSYNIILLDLTQLQSEVVANPEKILGPGNTSFFLPPDEDLSGFNVHPSIQTQEIIASWVTDMVNAPLPFVVVGDYPVDLMAGNLNNSYNRLYLLKHGCPDRSGFRFYAEASEGAYQMKKKGSEITGKSDLWSVGFGAEYQFEDRHTLGLKLAHMESDVKINQFGLKDLEFNETLVSLYGFYFPGNFNIALIGSYGALDIESTRTITIGVDQREEKGSGSGDHWLGSARISYDFTPYKPVTLTPYIGIDLHNVRVKSIKEHSNSSTAMEFKPPRSRAQFYRIGIETTGEFHFNDNQFCLTPFINLAYVEERRQRSNKIKARSTRFDRFFELKSSDVMGKDHYLFFDIGTGLALSPKDSINVNYQTRLFSDKQSGHNFVAFYSRAI